MTDGQWRFHPHAQKRMTTRGFSAAEVMAIVTDGARVETPSKGRPNRREYTRDGCTVVVNPQTRVILTVFGRTPRTTPPASPAPIPERTRVAVSAETVQSITERTAGRLAEPTLPADRPKHCTFEWVETLPERSSNPRGAKEQQATWLNEVVTPRLRHKPGEWAEIFHYDTAGSASSKLKDLRAAHPQLEFTARGEGKPKQPGAWSKVYARFMPAEQTEPGQPVAQFSEATA